MLKKWLNILKNHDKITWVNCAMLEDDKQYAKAQKYMPNGTCGVVSFGIKGGRAAATKFSCSSGGRSYDKCTSCAFAEARQNIPAICG